MITQVHLFQKPPKNKISQCCTDKVNVVLLPVYELQGLLRPWIISL